MPLRFTMQEQDTLLAWAAPRCGMPGCVFPDPAVALGVIDEDGTIFAVAVYIPLYSGSVECHFASNGTRRWASRENLAAMARYPFHQFQCDRLTATVEATDIATLTSCIKAGWQIEARYRNAMASGADAIVLSMTEEDCKFLIEEVHYGRR